MAEAHGIVVGMRGGIAFGQGLPGSVMCDAARGGRALRLQGPFVGTFPLALTVLHREYSTPEYTAAGRKFVAHTT